ncbi:hypothetical protein [Pseudomonas sp. NPDC089734]|uniref:hypothetical protein n=1 Tax=Pseudomonas sp. NPDC089734 TaxID=3364469 RepID=UPI0038101C84
MYPVKVGKNFRTLSPLRGVVQLVSPEENVNGLIITTGLIAAANGAVNVFIGATAPTSLTDFSKAIIFSGNGNSAAGSNAEVVLPFPLLVPAGNGLWAASQTTGTAAVAMTWDLLA